MTTCSIIIVTRNQLPYTKLCVESILKYTKDVDYELIFVDNGSTDGTIEYLKTVKNSRIIENKENVGFAKACNQGISAASSGKYILLLNNDVVVTGEWLKGLIECAESDPKIGLVGPASNVVYSIGSQNPEIKPTYKDLNELPSFAISYREKNKGRYVPSEVLFGFCLLIKREVIDKIGLLDERFKLGYEDSDYSLRASIAQFKLMVAQDVFVHHFLGKTIKAEKVEAMQEESRKYFAEKWKGIEKEIEKLKKLKKLL